MAPKAKASRNKDKTAARHESLLPPLRYPHSFSWSVNPRVKCHPSAVSKCRTRNWLTSMRSYSPCHRRSRTRPPLRRMLKTANASSQITAATNATGVRVKARRKPEDHDSAPRRFRFPLSSVMYASPPAKCRPTPRRRCPTKSSRTCMRSCSLCRKLRHQKPFLS